LAADLRDMGMVKQPVEHSRRQRFVITKRSGPLGKRQVAGNENLTRYKR